MYHSRQHRIGALMTGHIDQCDSRKVLASLEVGNHLVAAALPGAPDSRIQVVPLLEVHVDEVVASDDSIQGNDLSVYVDAVQLGDTPGFGFDGPGDAFEVLQLVGDLGQGVQDLGSCHALSSFLCVRGALPCRGCATTAPTVDYTLGRRLAGVEVYRRRPVRSSGAGSGFDQCAIEQISASSSRSGS